MTAVSDAGLTRAAWGAWWFIAAMVAGGMALAVTGPSLAATWDNAAGLASDLAFAVVILAFPITGLLILRREPRNTIGWVLLAIGLVWGLGAVSDNYAVYGLLVSPGSVPRPDVAAALNAGIWAPGIGLMGTFLILLYPDGHLPSPRWRPLAWVSAVTIVALFVIIDVSPGALEAGPFPDLENPLGVESAAPLLTVLVVIFLPLLPLCMIACAVALVQRFRRSHGIERLQLKWLATAAALVATLYLVGIATSLSNFSTPAGLEPTWLLVLQNLTILSFVLLPLAIGVAILRHRLYDIDIVIKRTLVYGALTAALLGTYVALVLVLQLALQPLTTRSDLAVAASTLAVAALFRPLRTRIQRGVDHRFFRRRYDAAQTLERFAVHLRDELDVESLGTGLRGAVRDAMQPAHVSLWLRPR